MEKINIAELLKDCPKGMELDSTLLEGLEFDSIVDSDYLPICCRIKNSNGGYNVYNFTKHGCLFNSTFAKCLIFPKGKTTWEGFVPPCKFKDGDILAYTSSHTTVFIYRNKDNEPKYTTSFYVGCTIGVGYCDFHIYNQGALIALNGDCDVRLATEEEKHKLFDAIKENGYRWNAETKTLEELVEPKFKVGDRIQSKDFIEERTIKICEEDGYWTTVDTWIGISDQDDWELVPNKFDIATLKPFDKVFVRDNNTQEWVISFFSHCNGLEIYKYSCINGHGYAQCVPYEENKHLLGTTNDCDDFYKTWEK